MKQLLILLVFCIVSCSKYSQKSSVQMELDSLKTVHNVCNIKTQITLTSNSVDSLTQEKEKLLFQLRDIEMFKLGRTELEKEKQLTEIHNLIKQNEFALKESSNFYNKLLYDLQIAKHKVDEL
ncbi:MAG: hypothetical protein GYB35_07465 [Algicola sp.]|nr:hypothetical protein [Algicola sp.]